MNLFIASKTSNGILNLNNSKIICDGNSLTSGGYGGETYPNLLLSKLLQKYTNVTVINKGVGGQQTTGMISDAVSDIDVNIDLSKVNILCVWEVGNDIYFNGNVNNAITNITTYCQARKAAGWKIVLLGLCDRYQITAFGDNQSQYRAKLSEANMILKNTYKTIGADVFIDIGSDSRLQDATDLSYFNSDSVHLIQAGNNVVADMVMKGLRKL